MSHCLQLLNHHRAIFPWILVILLFSITNTQDALAQGGGASISGQISDRTGSIIRDAEIDVTNKDTNIKRVTVSNSEGLYNFSSLPPGNYVLSVHKQGFRSVDLTSLTVYTQDELERNFVLDVGSVSESVTVSGGTTDVSQGISTVIDHQFIDSVPLNGKDMTTLFELSPGTILNSGGNPSEGGGFSVNGQRSTANYLMIDGVSGNAYTTAQGSNVTGATIATSASGGTNGILPIDAIEEYRMDTSTYTAENGRTPGGQIQVKTRGGTNEFHGTLFENFRNQDLDANDWFANYNQIPQSALHMNDFGGTFGGPVLRDRIFFFAAHDTLLLNQPNTSSKIDVPDQDLRSAAANVFQGFLKGFPQGNSGPDPSLPGYDFFSASYPFLVRNHTTSLRIDAQPKHGLQAFFRLNIAPSASTFTGFNSSQDQSNIYSYTGGATSLFASNLLNEITVNHTDVSAIYRGYVGSIGGNDPRAVIDNLPSGVAPSNSAFEFFINPDFSTAIINNSGTHNSLSQWNVTDVSSWSIRHHVLKFGADVLNKQSTVHAVENVYYADTGVESKPPYTSLYSGVLSYLTYVHENAQPVIRLTNLSLFANDDWRLRPSLLINLGLRWEFNPAPSIGPLGVLALQGDSLDPATISASVSNHPLYASIYSNFAPRFGFAWSMGRNANFATTIRGGGGIYFDTGQASTANEAATSTYPYQSTAFNSNLTYSSIDWTGLSTNASSLPQSNVTLVDRRLQSPRTYEWSLTLDQQFGPFFKLLTSYVGNDGEKLIGQYSYLNEPNALGIYPVNTGLISQYGYLYLTANQSHSNYQALQTQLVGHMSQRLDLLASYTWAHAEDNGSTDFSSVGGSALNPLSNSLNDIRSIFAAAIHYQQSSMLRNRFIAALTSHWGLDTIARLQTSPPFTITANTSNPNAFLPNADIVTGQPVVLHEYVDSFGQKVPGGKEINYNAFTSPPVDSNGNSLRQGNSPTNGYRLFGLKQWDVAANRSWTLHEGINLLFRVDAYNVLNTANLSNPNEEWYQGGASTFGRSSSTYANNFGSTPAGQGETGAQLSVFQNGGSRSLQLSAKIRF